MKNIEVNLIDKENINSIINLIPTYFHKKLKNSDFLTFCIFEYDIPISISLIKIFGDTAVIKWIFTIENYQKQGYGSYIISYIKEYLAKKGVLSINTIYEKQNNNAIGKLLLSQQFIFRLEKACKYKIFLKDLEKAPIMDFVSKIDLTSNHNVMNFSQIPKSYLNDFRQRKRQELDFIASEFDDQNIDLDLSTAFILDKKITGVLVISNQYENVINVDLMYNKGISNTGILYMINNTLQNIFNKSKDNCNFDDKVMIMTAKAHSAQKFIQKVFDVYDKEIQYFYSAKCRI